MHLTDEAERKRKLPEPLQPVHHRIDVVRDLAHVVDRFARLGTAFEQQQLGQRRLRPLDLRRQYGFLAHVHVQEQFLARQKQRHAVEPTECALRIVELRQEADRFDRRVGRQGCRHEGAHGFSPRDSLDVCPPAPLHSHPLFK